MRLSATKIVYLIIALLLFFTVLSTTVVAHSGGTDSSGGHRGPGGYHYHHGYSAHKHIDSDGDGEVDCPYDFYDNTDSDSNASSASSHETSIDNPVSVTAYFLVGLLLDVTIASLLLFLVFIPHMNKKRNKRVYSATHRMLTRDEILQRVNIPPNITINEKFLPIPKSATSEKPYGEYTVYTSYSGVVAHAQKGCGNAQSPIHIYANYRRPCKRCFNEQKYNKLSIRPPWYNELISLKDTVIEIPDEEIADKSIYKHQRFDIFLYCIFPFLVAFLIPLTNVIFGTVENTYTNTFGGWISAMFEMFANFIMWSFLTIIGVIFCFSVVFAVAIFLFSFLSFIFRIFTDRILPFFERIIKK